LRDSLAEGSRYQPVKPAMPALRMFSKTFTDVRVNQQKLWGQDDRQKKAKSKFMAFVESVEAIDEEVKQED
jgi:hypothetical protein